METVKNVAEILVATQITSETVLSSMTTVGDMAVSYLNGVITDGADALKVSDIAAGTPYRLVVRVTGGGLQWSDIIYKGTETLNYTAYAAGASQIDYIGYNGSANGIDAINSNLYTVRLLIQSRLISGFMQQLIKEGFYESDASATQYEVALNLAKSLAANLKREAEQLVKVERVNSGTSLATSAGALTFVKGSKYVSWPEDGTNNDAGKYNTDAASVAAGDYIRVGHATTKTYPVYKVVAVTGVATSTIYLELDQEYQGDSGSVAANVCGIIPAASVGSDWGIKLTAVKRTFTKGATHDYVYPQFTTVLQDFGTTVLTNSTAASQGIGTYEWVAQKEYEFQMNEYPYRRTVEGGEPDLRSEAASTSTYGIFVIEHEHDQTNTLGTSAASKKQTYVACVAAGCTNMATALALA